MTDHFARDLKTTKAELTEQDLEHVAGGALSPGYDMQIHAHFHPHTTPQLSRYRFPGKKKN
jgi:hypothetical protein